MRRGLLVALLLTGASCHHAVPPQKAAGVQRYSFPAEAQDTDVFCVEAEANSAEPIVCVHVGQVRYYIRSQRYTE